MSVATLPFKPKDKLDILDGNEVQDNPLGALPEALRKAVQRGRKG